MIALCLSASLLLAPQQPFPDLPDPQGSVRDEQGQPVVGAKLGIEPDRVPGPWRQSLLHVLHTQPIPPLTSGRDGTFVLPLTRDQRRLGAHLRSGLAFVVRMPGYQDWIEELPLGVYGWLGSEVVLHRPGADEWREVRMREPVPGMLARVDSTLLPDVVVPLDQEGRARVPVYAMPRPPALADSRNGVGWGATVRVLYPGRSSPAVPIEGGGDALVLSSQPTGLERTVTVRRSDGAATTGLRGLYRVGDDLLWFDLEGAQAVSAATCELIAVTAEGCLAADAGNRDEIELQPLPESAELYVHDPEGNPVPRAAVFFHPLANWHRPVDLSEQTPTHRARTDRMGRFALLDRLREEPGCLEIAAPGFQLLRVLEPRSGGTFVLQPATCGTLRLRLRSRRGEALAGATVFLSDSAYAAGLAAERVPSTDGDGVLELQHLPTGAHSLVPVIEGHAFVKEKFTVAAGETTDLELELASAAEIRALTVDDNDEPVPFVSLSRHWDNKVGSRKEYASDSRGRLWIRDIPADRTLVLRQPSRGGSEELRMQADEIRRLAVERGRLVSVLLPPVSRVFRTIWHQDSGGTTSNGDPGDEPAFSRYLLYWTAKPSTELRLGIADGPPVRVRGDQVPLRDEQDRVVDAPLVIDRRSVTRRIPLQLEMPEGMDAQHLRVEPVSPHYGGRMHSTQNGNMAVRDDQGRWWLQARDRGPWRLVALAPGCEPEEFRLEEAPQNGQERPVRLELERSGMLSLRLVMPARPRSSADFTLRLDREGEGIHTYFQDTSLALQDLTPGEPFSLPFPVGLKPGPYELRIVLPAAGDEPARTVERTFEIGHDEPVLLDLQGEG